ncbi:MAG: FliH/SctL family protein, partial [Desulfocapsaceae bacterium]|nr:FliH/SctL family protein [Desulfocapsaceae bacterium]
MNSSKNRPNAFVPEKIIPLKGAGQSGWRSVSLPIAQQEIRQILSEIDGSGAAGARQPMQEHSQADREGPDSAHGEEAERLASEQGQQDLENLRKNAYDEGVRDGLKMADEDFGASARALLMACEQISTLRETILHNSMEEMQNLVLAIAEKIIRHSVTVQNDTIIATVEEAIRQAVKTDELTIEVNPA